ncbi:MAG: hypothetical protein U1E99_01275 [Agitococcus sp.]
MNKTTMLYIKKSLEYCAVCPGFYGAALSSPDGLVIASHGKLEGDEPAACASSLIFDCNTSLSYVSTDKTKEILIWSDEKLWNVRQLDTDFILLIASSDLNSQDAIRTVMQKATTMLDQALKFLG